VRKTLSLILDENGYSVNKHKLPEEVVEDMREAYRRGQEYLQTTKASAG
jgi:hypothetical protein